MLLIKGDCLDVMQTLPDKSIDCFVCDLPYGCLSGRSIGKSAQDKKCWSGDDMGCDWDIKIDLTQFWEQVKRLAKDDHTPVLMFCTTKFGAELINSNPSWFRYDIVWSKSRGVGFLCANKQPLRSHEMIYVFSKKGAYYKRVDIKGDFPETIGIYGKDKGVRCVKSVVEVANKKGRGNHPTQKPAELYRWLLERYCPENGTMLDPTAGSFASCFTAEEMGLKAIGIEKDTSFFWKAVSQLN